MPVGKFGFRRVAGGGIPPQDPCDLKIGPGDLTQDCHSAASLIYWYQADNGIVAEEGAQFSPWSGHGGTVNATQPTASARPRFKTHKNGIPTVRCNPYDGTNGGFCYRVAGSRVRASLTVYFTGRFYVSNPLSTPFTDTDGTLLAAQSTNGGIVFSCRSLKVNPTIPQVHLQASKGLAMAPYTVEAPTICGWQVLAGVLDSVNSLMSIYRTSKNENAVLLASAAYTPQAATTDVSWGILGGDAYSGGGGFTDFEGDCTEIVVNYAAHDAATVLTNSTCLFNRWGLK